MYKDYEFYHTRRPRGRIQLKKNLNYSSVVCDAFISTSSQFRIGEIVWSVRSPKCHHAKPLAFFPTLSRTVLVG